MSVIHITKENFEELTNQSEKAVLIDFRATWCGPCKMIAPIVEQIAAERSDIIVGEVDVDAQMELAVKFGITSIPTLVVMKNGAVTATSVGYRPKQDILALLEK